MGAHPSGGRIPWKCPACQTHIRHDDDTRRPHPVYRCIVCHLELVVDEDTQTLTVAPLPDLPVTQSQRRRASLKRRIQPADDEADA